MSCASGTSYIVKAGDTLFIVAERKFGDGNRWSEIKNPDGTSPDPNQLQLGQELCLPGAPPPGGNESFSNVVRRMLELANQQRRKAGLSPITLNPQLMTAAQRHSQDMADRNFLEHNGSDGSSPFDRMRRAGYQFSSAGENVAAGQSTPEAAMSSWMNETPPNDGHRQNILSPKYRETGIGYAFSNATRFKHYWTQDFGSQQ